LGDVLREPATARPFRPKDWFRGLTPTERNGVQTALILLGSILFFAAIRAVERGLGRWEPDVRVVPDPAETTMRYLGQAHFLMAYLFTATSRRMKSARPWGRFALLFVLGLLFCASVSFARSWAPFAGTVLVYTYFLLHEFRDQSFFYFTNGDAPAGTDRPALRKAILSVPWLAVGAVAAVLSAAAALGLPAGAEIRDFMGRLTPAARWAVGLAPALAVTIGTAVFFRHLRKEGLGSLRDLLRTHRPVFFVYAGSLTILLVGGFLGWRLHTIVIFHVVSWYVFSVHLMRARLPAAPPRKGGWAWLRSTPSGFTLLHAGIAVALLAGGVVWAYALENAEGAGALWLLLDSGNFQYWTILHVTVSLPSK
jgi:hypothetical protein